LIPQKRGENYVESRNLDRCLVCDGGADVFVGEAVDNDEKMYPHLAVGSDQVDLRTGYTNCGYLESMTINS
jgi:hypothetical protein